MERSQKTRAWPMRYVGVWCIFGIWNYSYSTLKEAIRDPHVEIVCVYTNQATLKEVPTLSQDWGIHSSFCIDESWSIEEIVTRVSESLSVERPFLAAVCFNEAELALANQLNEMLGGLRPLQEAIRSMIDKYTLYTTLEAAELPVARFHLWQSVNDLAVLLSCGLYHQGYYILKPVWASDSAGVYRSRSSESLHDTIQVYREGCKESVRIGQANLAEQPSLIMEYVDYDGVPVEVTADGIVVQGEVVFHVIHEKLHTPAFSPFFDRRMVAPPLLPEISARQEQIAATTRALVSALHMNAGVFHIEYRLTKQQCIPIDCAFRPGGGFIPHAIYALTGVDLILAHVESHFQNAEIRHYPSKLRRGSCIGALYASPIINATTFKDLAVSLAQRPEVLGLYVKAMPATDPRFTVDAGLSLGVIAPTSREAHLVFEDLVKFSAKIGSI